MTTIHVLAVDDHPAIAEAIALRAAETLDVRVVARATTLDEAERAIGLAAAGTRIDVVVCDVQLAGRAEGLTLLARHAYEGRPRFLMLSAFDQPAMVRTAFERGAAGYPTKDATIDAILDAIRTVAAGGSVYPPSVSRALESAYRLPSEREQQVIALVAEGLSNDEIGVRLGLSMKTIESHLRRMFDRYGVMSRTELVVVAMRQGWLEPAPG